MEINYLVKRFYGVSEVQATHKTYKSKNDTREFIDELNLKSEKTIPSKVEIYKLVSEIY